MSSTASKTRLAKRLFFIERFFPIKSATQVLPFVIFFCQAWIFFFLSSQDEMISTLFIKLLVSLTHTHTRTCAQHTHTLKPPLDTLTLFISGSFRDWNGGLGFSRAVNQRVSWHLVLCFPFQSNTCITCYEPTARLLAPALYHWQMACARLAWFCQAVGGGGVMWLVLQSLFLLFFLCFEW